MKEKHPCSESIYFGNSFQTVKVKAERGDVYRKKFQLPSYRRLVITGRRDFKPDIAARRKLNFDDLVAVRAERISITGSACQQKFITGKPDMKAIVILAVFTGCRNVCYLRKAVTQLLTSK